MNMPKFIQIIGPQAVGKMTVGQELAKITGYKLLYNHMTIEMVRLIFDYDKEAFRKMNSIIRYEIFKEFIIFCASIYYFNTDSTNLIIISIEIIIP